MQYQPTNQSTKQATAIDIANSSELWRQSGILSEVDSGYYPTQMERRGWSDSFAYVTI